MFYTLSELANDRWNLTEDEILHLAVAEKISLSVYWGGAYWERINDEEMNIEKERLEEFVTLTNGDILKFLIPKSQEFTFHKDMVEICHAYRKNGQKIAMIMNPLPILEDENEYILQEELIRRGKERGKKIVFAPRFKRSGLIILSEEVYRFESEHPDVFSQNDAVTLEKKPFTELRNPPGSKFLTGWKEINQYLGIKDIKTGKKYAKLGGWLRHNGTNKPITTTFEIDEGRKMTSKKK